MGEDRARPIYKVYKNGRPVSAPAEIQWMIRDLAREHGYDEKIMIGMIVMESTFRAGAIGGIRCVTHEPGCALGCDGTDDECGCPTPCELDPEPCVYRGRWYGLAQLSKFWLRCSKIAQYRLTDDYMLRDLLNPWHNLLTTVEIWNYAGDAYMLDLETELGWVKLLYWHNTGRDPQSVAQWAYASAVFRYAAELVEAGGAEVLPRMGLQPE